MKLLRVIDLLHSMEKKVNLVLVEAGISFSQFRILRAIEAKPGLLLSEISHKLDVTKPTITVQLKGLHKMNAIRLESDPGDKRGKRIYLTDTGKNRIANAYDNLLLLEKNSRVRLKAEFIEDIEKIFS